MNSWSPVPWFLLIISGLSIIILVLIYQFFPAQEDSESLHKLMIEVIPSAIVALLVIPVAYVFLYKHGLTLEQQLTEWAETTVEQGNSHSELLKEVTSKVGLKANPSITDSVIESAESRHALNKLEGANVLLVIDIQNDFVNKEKPLSISNGIELIAKLNEAIKYAEINDFIVIFARDWHPKDHKQFIDFEEHCVENTDGAQLHDNLYLPEHRLIVDFGVNPIKEGYSPFENNALGLFLSSDAVSEIYVCGIALEFCVVEACKSAKKTGKSVFALKPLVADTGNIKEVARIWRELEDDVNVAVLKELPDILTREHRDNTKI